MAKDSKGKKHVKPGAAGASKGGAVSGAGTGSTGVVDLPPGLGALTPPEDQRKLVFARIQEALRFPAPVPGHAGHSHSSTPPAASVLGSSAPGAQASPPRAYREWLPAVGPSVQDQIALFARNSEELKTEFFECPDEAAAAQQIQKLSTEGNWSEIATHSDELALRVSQKTALPLYVVDEGRFDIARLERCPAAVSAVDVLIAQTGSLLVTARSAGGRALSVLPPHHIAVARRSQIVPDLPAAYEFAAKKYGMAPGGYPSFMSFITGPSRTGDIERILVLGAHGPKRLTVLLIG
ncbi:MAG: lactate utilization protein C [Candidatus Methylacidiphilales bacterium]|nr:lactate utilization protein [Candidatus Methylacidiphilales bacterium]